MIVTPIRPSRLPVHLPSHTAYLSIATGGGADSFGAGACSTLNTPAAPEVHAATATATACWLASLAARGRYPARTIGIEALGGQQHRARGSNEV